MSKESCSACLFFKGHTCRRHAPSIVHIDEEFGEKVDHHKSAWPSVSSDDWCGEFKKAKGSWAVPDGYIDTSIARMMFWEKDLDCSREDICRYAKRGILPHVRRGAHGKGPVYVSKSAVEELISRTDSKGLV